MSSIADTSVKNERIAIRCSKQEKEMIAHYCKCKRYAVSDFIRILALEYIEKHPLDEKEQARGKY